MITRQRLAAGVFALLAALTAGIAVPSTAVADETTATAPKVNLLLDVSGSMRAKDIDGQSRMAAAKQAFRNGSLVATQARLAFALPVTNSFHHDGSWYVSSTFGMPRLAAAASTAVRFCLHQAHADEDRPDWQASVATASSTMPIAVRVEAFVGFNLIGMVGPSVCRVRWDLRWARPRAGQPGGNGARWA